MSAARMAWQRMPVEEVKRLRNIGFGEEGPEKKDHFFIYRLQGTVGAPWPRLVLTASLSPFEPLIRISCSIKETSSKWWNEVQGIPKPLVKDAIALLQETIDGQ